MKRAIVTLFVLCAYVTLGYAAVSIPTGCSGPSQQHVVERAGSVATTALAAVNAARDNFLEWNSAHELDIVDHATSMEEGTRNLAEYRERRQVVTAAFQAAYGAIAAAAALLPLAEAGKVTQVMLLDALSEVATAIEAIRGAVDAIMEKKT